MNKTGNIFSRAFHSLSVSKKIVLLATLSSTVTLILFTAVIGIRDWNSFAKGKIDQLASVSRIVASYSEAALIFKDSVTATEYLNSLSQEKDITMAILYDSEGHQFATYIRDKQINTNPTLADFETYQIDSEAISYSLPISKEGEFLGTLIIKSDTRSIKEDQVSSLMIAISISLLGLLLTLFLASRCQEVITSPLLELAKLARKVSLHRDYTLRARKHHDDEVGSLANSFNFMLERIHERDIAINEHNRNLEKEVLNRTRELKIAMEEAKAASKTKSDFLSTMSHELRTPMNAIIGMTSFLAESDIDEKHQEYLRIISHSSDALLALINDVLDYSKIESGKLELEETSFSLVKCLEEAVDMISAQSRDTNKLLISFIDPSLPRYLIGDQTRLRQVVINLLSNAWKFTERGHILLEAIKASEDTFRISITDTGVGISKEKQDRLFKSFSQVDTSTTRKYGGTGLGLAISQKLTLAMGGKIKLESEEGRGSCFYFSLPIQTNRPLELVGSKKPQATSVALFGFDEPLLSRMKTTLTAWDCQVSAEQQPPSNAAVHIHSAITDDSDELDAFITQLEQQGETPAKRIIIAHGEYVNHLKSKSLGQVITLPLKIQTLSDAIDTSEAPTTQKPKPIKAEPKTNVERKRELKILLAEDNEVNQRVFIILMQREGYEIDIVSNGLEAVHAIKKKTYDIVFMDLQMPVMDGIEACKKIRSLKSSIEQPWIIGFTANVEADAEPAMKEAGMNDYLAKPVKDNQVHQKLLEFCSIHQGDPSRN